MRRAAPRSLTSQPRWAVAEVTAVWQVRGWAVAAAIMAASAATFGLPALIPAIGDTLSLSPATLGVVVAMVGAGRLVADLPAGWVADRWPEEWALALAGVLLTLGSGCMVAASALPALLAGAALIGVASALVGTVGMTIYARRAAPQGRGRAMAAYSLALLSGQTVGPGVAGTMASLTSWRLALVMVGALGGVVTAAAGLVAGSGPRQPRPPTAPPARPMTGRAVAYVAILSVPFCTFWGLGGLVQAVMPRSGMEVGWSAATVGAVLLAGGIGRLASAWVAGRAADRWGRRVALLPGPVIMTAGAALLAAQLPAAWLLGVVLLAAGSQGISVGSAMMADLAAESGSHGRLLGRYRLAGDLGILLGPAVSAWLLAHHGAIAAVTPTVVLLLTSAARGRAASARNAAWFRPLSAPPRAAQRAEVGTPMAATPWTAAVGPAVDRRASKRCGTRVTQRSAQPASRRARGDLAVRRMLDRCWRGAPVACGRRPLLGRTTR